MPIQFLHKFTTNLPSDPIEENFTRQVNNAAFSYVKPKTPSRPKLIHLSKEVQNLIGFSDDFVASEAFLNIWCRNCRKCQAFCYELCRTSIWKLGRTTWRW
jgi:hypothetical protein